MSVRITTPPSFRARLEELVERLEVPGRSPVGRLGEIEIVTSAAVPPGFLVLERDGKVERIVKLERAAEASP